MAGSASDTVRVNLAERSYDISPASQSIFRRFVSEAESWTPRPIHTSVAKS